MKFWNSNIDVNLNADTVLDNQTISELSIGEFNGITFIAPSENSISSNINIWVMRDKVLFDFFNIGKLLEKGIGDLNSYIPLYLDNQLEKNHEAFDILGDNEIVLLRDFRDDKCPFFKNLEYKDRIIDSILIFIKNYGFLFGNHERFYQNELKILQANVYPQNRYKWFVCPITCIAYWIFETYYKYTYPRIYASKMKEKEEVTEDLVPPILFNVRFRAITIFNEEKNTWETYNRVRSLMDMIIVILFHTPNIVKTCLSCNNIFITEDERMKYCSAKCRNRANVKKNYEKRKRNNTLKEGDKNGNHNET